MVSTPNPLRRSFFDAAFTVLAAEGFRGIKLRPLCASMGVTTGAFYHSFSSWKDFTDQLLGDWYSQSTTRLVEASLQFTDPLDRLENLLLATINLPHPAEAAIRVWAAIDPDVGKLQEQVDRDRYEVVYDSFLSLVGDPAVAARLSRTGMFLLIGSEQSAYLRDPETLEWALRMVKQDAADRSVARAKANSDPGMASRP